MPTLICPVCQGKNSRCLICEGKGVVDAEKLDELLERWTDTEVTWLEEPEVTGDP